MSKKKEKTNVVATKLDVAFALKQWKKDSPEIYYKLLKHLSQDVPVSVLKAYLKEFVECIPLLDQHFYDFVRVILSINWYVSESLCKEYLDFLVALSIAQPVHLTNVLIALVQRFRPNIDPLQAVLVQQRQHLTICGYVQVALKSIQDRVPMMQSTLMGIIMKQFPYFKHDIFQVECYVRNLLQLTLSMPTYRFQILELVVSKITAFDVSCPRHDILNAEKEEEAADSVFNMEIEKKTEDQQTLLKLPTAEVLDILMNLLLTYIQNTCHNNFNNNADYSKVQLDWNNCKRLFKELLLIFETIILPTDATCHVQFIFFFICKYNVNLCDGFIDYLWKKCRNPNTNTIFRQACASYLGSFLARSIYLPTSSIIMCLDEFCNWIHSYIDLVAVPKDKSNLLSSHGSFYYLCQAVLYVVVFRHRSIFESSKGYNRMTTWNFQRIVTCQLNPLKFCSQHLVDKFACVMRLHQLAMCDTIIERNKRELLEDDCLEVFTTEKKKRLDCFFPFDPCILPRTNKFIKPLYREYDSVETNTATVQAMNDDDVDFLPPEPCDSSMQDDLSEDGLSLASGDTNAASNFHKNGKKIPQRLFNMKKQVIEAMMESL